MASTPSVEKPGFATADALQTLQHESRSHEKDEAQRNLEDDECRAQTRAIALARRAARVGLERRRQVGTARVQRRHRGEHDHRHDADHRAERTHAPIKVAKEGVHDPAFRRKKECERIAQPVGEERGAARGDRREQQCLGEKLAYQAHAAGAQ